MSLHKKRPLAALYFANRIIQRHFPLRAFVAPNVGNPFMGVHFFTSANALYLHGVRHPSLLTGALTAAIALLLRDRFLYSWRHVADRPYRNLGAARSVASFPEDRGLGGDLRHGNDRCKDGHYGIDWMVSKNENRASCLMRQVGATGLLTATLSGNSLTRSAGQGNSGPGRTRGHGRTRDAPKSSANG